MLKGGVNKDGRKTSKDFCRRVCLACEFTRLEEILLRSTTMIIFSGNATMCEFFFLIQPFSSFGLAGKNRGLISFLGSRTIRTIQFKFKYRSVFFFILHSAPSQIVFENPDISLRDIIFLVERVARENGRTPFPYS